LALRTGWFAAGADAFHTPRLRNADTGADPISPREAIHMLAHGNGFAKAAFRDGHLLGGAHYRAGRIVVAKPP
jgi:hypothetical protein